MTAPHTCPKCHGERVVAADPNATARGSRTCPTCSGSGVVWEPGERGYQPGDVIGPGRYPPIEPVDATPEIKWEEIVLTDPLPQPWPPEIGYLSIRSETTETAPWPGPCRWEGFRDFDHTGRDGPTLADCVRRGE